MSQIDIKFTKFNTPGGNFFILPGVIYMCFS